MNLRVAGPIFLAIWCVVVCGCSSKSGSAPSSMGPMPTQPPAGSPYASTAASGPSPDEFVSKLQSQSGSERAAYMQQNRSVMNSILASPSGTPAKDKLLAIINQH